MKTLSSLYIILVILSHGISYGFSYWKDKRLRKKFGTEVNKAVKKVNWHLSSLFVQKLVTYFSQATGLTLCLKWWHWRSGNTVVLINGNVPGQVRKYIATQVSLSKCEQRNNPMNHLKGWNVQLWWLSSLSKCSSSQLWAQWRSVLV